MNINHIVMVNGDETKTVCTRLVVRHGTLIDNLTVKLCEHCINKGWTKSISPFGNPVNKDGNGRYLSREKSQALLLSEM
jgi:hypothetical protein